jgi:hypothetical protein
MPNGGWKYPAPRTQLRSADDYDQLETFRMLSILIEKHGLDRGHPAIHRASRYVLAHQSVAGDVRGIYGNQYSPNYTAAFLELLTKVGYGADPAVRRSFRWLLSVRQDDGGWAIPFRTTGRNFDPSTLRTATIHPVLRKPSSHLVTGVVLRALAAHPQYRKSQAARAAGALLAARMFKADVYADRRAAAFWTQFSYPFWFTDLVSALDSLSLVGFSREDPLIRRAWQWLVEHQDTSGLWKLRMTRGGQDPARYVWLTLAVCRVFRRLFI